MPRDLGEGEGAGLRDHLRALQLGSRRHEAVEDARLLDVHHVGQEPDAAVVVERLGLELVGDRPGLVPDVSGVVPEPRDSISGIMISLALRPARAMLRGEFRHVEHAARL